MVYWFHYVIKVILGVSVNSKWRQLYSSRNKLYEPVELRQKKHKSEGTCNFRCEQELLLGFKRQGRIITVRLHSCETMCSD